VRTKTAVTSTRRFPAYAIAGLGLIAISEAGVLAHIEPFWSWHTPIAWTGYILFIDGWIWRRRGESPIRNYRAETLLLALVSVPLWIIFELYNKYTLGNWHYTGLPETLLVRYIGYAWAFATISPAILITASLVGALRERRAPAYRREVHPPLALGVSGWICVVLGTAMLLLPIVRPSQWLAAPVWLGFILLLDPINARFGAESLRSDLREGHRDRLINLLVSGLVCGLLWEFWNYWAHTKWVYTVPVPPHIKLFEMPVAGYLGFPAFAVECFVMYAFVRHWVWRGSWRPSAL
jgi:hypothetical protein